MTAWTETSVRSCPFTSCGVVGKLYAGDSRPARCWVVGRSVTDEGVTNDKGVRLTSNAGGAGCVSGIPLDGGGTGGVSTRWARGRGVRQPGT